MAANPLTQKQPGGYGSSPFMKPQASPPLQQSPYGQPAASSGGFWDPEDMARSYPDRFPDLARRYGVQSSPQASTPRQQSQAWGGGQYYAGGSPGFDERTGQQRGPQNGSQAGGYGSPPYVRQQPQQGPQDSGGMDRGMWGNGFSPDQVRQNAPGRARPAVPPGEQDAYARYLGGSPDFDERTGTNTRREYAPGYGGRIGQPPGTMNTMEIKDEDGDGVDDRYQPGPGQKPPDRERSSPPRRSQPAERHYAGGSPGFDERTGQQANPYQSPPWMPQAAPGMTFASGDWQGGYASAAPQDRPPPMSVQAFGPWGQTNDPFGQRDALIGRLQQQNMQRQGAFNSFGPQAPQGSPWLDYGMAAQQAGVYSPQWAQQPGPISGLNQQFGGGGVMGGLRDRPDPAAVGQGPQIINGVASWARNDPSMQSWVQRTDTINEWMRQYGIDRGEAMQRYDDGVRRSARSQRDAWRQGNQTDFEMEQERQRAASKRAVNPYGWAVMPRPADYPASPGQWEELSHGDSYGFGNERREPLAWRQAQPGQMAIGGRGNSASTSQIAERPRVASPPRTPLWWRMALGGD